LNITLHNNIFTLCPQKALFWQEQNTLLISDLHIGKILHFRKAGIAIPPQAVMENFARLDQLMKAHEVKKIIFIGDLFHSDVNNEWDQFCEWRKNYKDIEMKIVLGNHDKLPDSFCDDFNIEVHKKDMNVGPFTFSHYPAKEFKSDEEYVFSGHIHPVIVLSGKASQHIKLPCFYFGKQQAILPSFGYFTGGYRIEPVKGDRVVGIAEGKLVEVRKL
jgi:DNA ligase-associated metallophosphoesterase